jgi:DNA-directed RNA polymerase specialized sigma24 family protein
MADPDVRDASRRESLDAVRSALRELHGPRLHGFALLLTLGDTRLAEGLASDALAAGQLRIDGLRHPERAAAWLRARVVRGARRGRVRRGHRGGDPGALADLGADQAVVAGLASLDRIERAALVASAIERLDARDVAVVVGRSARSLERLLSRARVRYAAAYLAADADHEPIDGPLGRRLREIAHRAMG